MLIIMSKISIDTIFYRKSLELTYDLYKVIQNAHQVIVRILSIFISTIKRATIVSFSYNS